MGLTDNNKASIHIKLLSIFLSPKRIDTCLKALRVEELVSRNRNDKGQIFMTAGSG